MRTEKLEFTGHGGDTLAARFDQPDGPVKAVALFAHCFTCSKDIAAARRIAARLAGLGIAVLRFDFTGLGHSQGEFANTHFSSNVADLVVALHLHQSAGDNPLSNVEIEQSKVGSLETDLVSDLLRMLLEGAVEFEVGVERYDDLVLEDTLVLQEQARQR